MLLWSCVVTGFNICIAPSVVKPSPGVVKDNAYFTYLKRSNLSYKQRCLHFGLSKIMNEWFMTDNALCVKRECSPWPRLSILLYSSGIISANALHACIMLYINWIEFLSVTTQCSKFTELKPEGQEIRLSVFLYDISIPPPCREPPLGKF